jgi:AcrR family transcriptional regulator
MAAPTSARDRLVATADRLFYVHGLRAVGIDRVIAEAGVAKATLYAHFPTKDDLILAALRHRETAVLDFLQAGTARHGGGLRGFFAALKDWFGMPGFRGCAFQNATAELADPRHPAAAFVRDFKRRFHACMAELVVAAGAPPAAAPAIALLAEGAVQMAVINSDPTTADVAGAAAEKLVTAVKG